MRSAHHFLKFRAQRIARKLSAEYQRFGHHRSGDRGITVKRQSLRLSQRVVLRAAKVIQRVARGVIDISDILPAIAKVLAKRGGIGCHVILIVVGRQAAQHHQKLFAVLRRVANFAGGMGKKARDIFVICAVRRAEFWFLRGDFLDVVLIVDPVQSHGGGIRNQRPDHKVTAAGFWGI